MLQGKFHDVLIYHPRIPFKKSVHRFSHYNALIFHFRRTRSHSSNSWLLFRYYPRNDRATFPSNNHRLLSLRQAKKFGDSVGARKKLFR